MSILSVIKNRRSIRAYEPKPVEKEKIEAVLKSAMFAPSARHTRAWEFVVVSNPELIFQLGELKAGGEHVKQAPVVIAIVSDEHDHWLEDASIVATHIYLEATNQGLGTCWTHIHSSQTIDGDSCEEEVKKLLAITPNKRVLCLMPLGYPAEKKEPHTDEEYEEDKIKWVE
jgi:nitroreductase